MRLTQRLKKLVNAVNIYLVNIDERGKYLGKIGARSSSFNDERSKSHMRSASSASGGGASRRSSAHSKMSASAERVSSYVTAARDESGSHSSKRQEISRTRDEEESKDERPEFRERSLTHTRLTPTASLLVRLIIEWAPCAPSTDARKLQPPSLPQRLFWTHIRDQQRRSFKNSAIRVRCSWRSAPSSHM